MTKADRLRKVEVKVVVRGFVDEVHTQSVPWTLQANQQICLRMFIETPPRPTSVSLGVSTEEGLPSRLRDAERCEGQGEGREERSEVVCED